MEQRRSFPFLLAAGIVLAGTLLPAAAWGQAVDIQTNNESSVSTSRMQFATGAAPTTITVLNSRMLFSSAYFTLPTGTSDPSDTTAGNIYYNSSTGKVSFRHGGAWNALAIEGGSAFIQASPGGAQSAFFNITNTTGSTLTSTSTADLNTALSIANSTAAGTSSATRYGLYSDITGTGTSTSNIAVYARASGGGTYNNGVTGTASGAMAEGVFGHAAGSGTNCKGVLARNEATGAGLQYGLAAENIGATVTGTKYGVASSVSGTASTSYGYYGTVRDATTNYGAWLSVGQAASGTVDGLVLQTDVNDAGVGSNNIGTGILFRAEADAAAGLQDAARIQGILTNVTNGSVAGAMTFQTRTGGGALSEKMKIDNAGIVTPGATDQDLGSSSLRWDVFGNTGDFDNTLTISSGTAQALSLTSTTTTGNAMSLTGTSLTTGKALEITASSNPAAAGPISPVSIGLTNANATSATTIYGVDIGLTNSPTIAANSEYAVRIQNKLTSNTTDNAVAALLLLDNADTTATGTTVVTDAIKITNSGGAGYTNLLETPSVDISAAGAISGVTSIGMSGALTSTATSNQLVLYSGVNQLTISSGTSAAARVYAVPDAGTTGSFVIVPSGQTGDGRYLRKNQSSVESASLTVNGDYLYNFTNNSTTAASGVLKATATGGTGSNGSFYGLYGAASRTDNTSDSTRAYSYAVYGIASGTTSTGGGLASNFGVYGQADGAQGNAGVVNYGVYGIANGTTSETSEGNVGVYGTVDPGSTSSATSKAVAGIAADDYALASAVTRNLYGGYFTATKSGASTLGTLNTYGVYASGTNSDATGGPTKTTYGIYATVSGQGTLYAGVFTGGNVGIGTATPGAWLEVDRPDTSSNSELVTLQSLGVTQTISGAVADARFNQFAQNTVTAGTAQTVTTSATVYIAGPTIAAGSATITNNYALWVGGDSAMTDRSGGTAYLQNTIRVVKTADESTSSDTTLSNDAELLFTIGANETWILDLCLLVASGTTPDFKCDFLCAAAVDIYVAVDGPADAAGLYSSDTDLTNGMTTPLDLACSAGTDTVTVRGYIQSGTGESGTVNFRWAQNTSSATATAVKKGSYLIAYKK